MTLLTKEHFDFRMDFLSNEISECLQQIKKITDSTSPPKRSFSCVNDFVSDSTDYIISYNRIDFTENLRGSVRKDLDDIDINLELDLDVHNDYDEPNYIVDNNKMDYTKIFNSSKISYLSDNQVRYESQLCFKFQKCLFVGFGTINNEMNNYL